MELRYEFAELATLARPLLARCKEAFIGESIKREQQLGHLQSSQKYALKAETTLLELE